MAGLGKKRSLTEAGDSPITAEDSPPKKRKPPSPEEVPPNSGSLARKENGLTEAEPLTSAKRNDRDDADGVDSNSGWIRLFPNDPRCGSDPDFNEEIASFRSDGTFPSFPPSRFQSGPPINFREPLKVGEFSLDHRRRFRNDASAKKFYVHPDSKRPLKLDLRKGYESFVKRDEEEKEFLDFILRWIYVNKVDLSGVDFVCWRGLLTKLLTTPFENREGWIIGASKFRGSWFLHDFPTQAKKIREAQMTEEHKEMTYWGYKFEQYVTSKRSRGMPEDADTPINNIEGYCRVVKTKVNSHSLLFAGEVDCLDDSSSPPEYVELKTSREFSNQRQNQNFLRFKGLKFWAQSFLLGIPRIVCGFRDDNGIVGRLETMKTLEIPHLARQAEGGGGGNVGRAGGRDEDSWNGDVCLRFLNEFLCLVKERATSPDPKDVVLFAFEPRKDIVVWRCQNNSKYVFLSEWFMKMV